MGQLLAEYILWTRPQRQFAGESKGAKSQESDAM
jgi:hypothetical protein